MNARLGFPEQPSVEPGQLPMIYVKEKPVWELSWLLCSSAQDFSLRSERFNVASTPATHAMRGQDYRTRTDRAVSAES
jgi:hypothetical protein